jgi:hypothetical protein
MKQALVKEILESVNELSVDPYGNYVVQVKIWSDLQMMI